MNCSHFFSAALSMLRFDNSAALSRDRLFSILPSVLLHNWMSVFPLVVVTLLVLCLWVRGHLPQGPEPSPRPTSLGEEMVPQGS